MNRTKQQTIKDADILLTVVYEESAPEAFDELPSWNFGFIDYPSYQDVIKNLIKKHDYTEEYISNLISDCKKYNISSLDEFEIPGDLVSAIKHAITESIDVNEGSLEYRKEQYDEYISDQADNETQLNDKELINKDSVLNFIKRFQNEGTIKTFTEGCCFWFAKILDERFNFDAPESGIFYNEIDNHFATMIDLHLYDITGDLGDIRNLPDWKPWIELDDDALVERIYRDCIEF